MSGFRNDDPSRGVLAEGAREVGGGLLRILYGLVALIAALGLFFGLGATLGFWSPGLAVVLIGAFGALGMPLWRRARYVVAAVSGVGGGGLGMILGSTEGLGFQIALGAGVLAMLALWSVLLEIFADV